MAKNYRVSLTAPYPSQDGWVRMRYGSTEAQIPDEMNSDSFVIDMRTRQPRIIPGKPIYYSLHHELQPEVMIPEDACKHFFGNFDLPRTNEPGMVVNEEMTYGYEKRRLTSLWGGFVRRPRDRSIANDFRSLEAIAPPPVPHVLVEELGNNMRPVEGSAFDPWAYWAWDKDCVANVWDVQGRRIDAQTPHAIPALAGAGMSSDQIEAMINKMVAEKMAEAKKKVSA